MIDFRNVIVPHEKDFLYGFNLIYPDYEVVKTIQGSYGLIFILENKPSKSRTAIKTISPNLVFQNGKFVERDLENLKRELRAPHHFI